ncbi:disintegrin and metalloproteinase domain-containing protein 19 isoform X2 [Oryzias melastigma]|uniref:disintegrin and metalloproteinase domain-containing protein 19 isoform X2 n=1 Tax=Oryzias melastigma TaxID=30732 RepID=UPI00168D4521|nr:disintegrin and metalloproteinase domain-containing protein 19 isoform X2 [Oryzias melastigma]
MPAGARPRRVDAVRSVLWLIVGLQCVCASEGNKQSIFDHIESYEITYPTWQHPFRLRRSASNEHPAEIQVLVTAEGHNLTLHLKKNEQLLAPGYQEIWYGPDGARKSSFLANTSHCLYHGDVLGIEESNVAVSTCSGLRGMISINTSLSYLIEPLHDSTDAQAHAIFRAKSVRLPRGSCMHLHRTNEHRDALSDFIYGMTSPWRRRRRREKREVSQNMKYVELLLVADKAEFQKHDYNLEKTKLKLLEAANLVDKFYKSLNIRVALIGLEIWTTQDKINVSDNPHSTLAAFLSWRRKQLQTLPNDNAQLITGKSFQGTTIGLSPLKVMCSDYESGGVNTDHSDLAVGVAATMAHEMGHNFGMTHDMKGCCQAKAEDGGCIMAPATGHPFPRVFNGCNLRELRSFLSSGGGKCLYNLPNTKAMYGGQRCGNGYLEEGEECDCGEEEECNSPCCNANNCTLRAGAECAHGVCCHNCKLKSPGVLCRASSGSCDLPEFCDGKTESCPADFYLMDGTSCAHGRAYCYTGMCLTLDLQCQSLWGRDGRPAPDKCFTEVNKAGDMYGNCGKDLFGKYRSCTDRDAKCGKIQCSTSASKPKGNNAVIIETSVSDGRKKIQCKGTHVYKLSHGDEEPQSDTLDPGLVMTGTKCGDNSVSSNKCFKDYNISLFSYMSSFFFFYRFVSTESVAIIPSLKLMSVTQSATGMGCATTTITATATLAGLHLTVTRRGQEGVWTAVLSSAKVRHIYTTAHVMTSSFMFLTFLSLCVFLGPLLVYILPFLLALLVFLAFLALWCIRRHKLLPHKVPAPTPALSCAVTVEDKPVRAVNPTFLQKQQDSPSPSGPSRHRNAIVRPAVKPPPVPAYAVKQKEQTSHPHAEPAAGSSSQSSPQGYTSSACKPPPLLPGPTCLLPQIPKNQPSSGTKKLRPDPPRRPPPPCPAIKGDQQEVKGLQETLHRGKATLAPSAGQKKTCRT